MVLVTKVYTVTNNFPKEEVLGLTSQIKRSAISISSNIAEGLEKKVAKSYCVSKNINWFII